METQNREVTGNLPETTAEKVLQLGSAPVEKLNNEWSYGRQRTDRSGAMRSRR